MGFLAKGHHKGEENYRRAARAKVELGRAYLALHVSLMIINFSTVFCACIIKYFYQRKKRRRQNSERKNEHDGRNCIYIFIACSGCFSLIDFYRSTVYNLSSPSRNHSARLYNKYKEVLEEYISSSVRILVHALLHVFFSSCEGSLMVTVRVGTRCSRIVVCLGCSCLF